MRIRLDEEKIKKEGKYNYDNMIMLLDETFEEMELYRIHDYSDILTYGGLDNPNDYAHFGSMYNSLKKRKWFMNNVLLWELHKPVDFFGAEYTSIEDLIPKCKEAIEKGEYTWIENV